MRSIYIAESTTWTAAVRADAQSGRTTRTTTSPTIGNGPQLGQSAAITVVKSSLALTGILQANANLSSVARRLVADALGIGEDQVIIIEATATRLSFGPTGSRRLTEEPAPDVGSSGPARRLQVVGAAVVYVTFWVVVPSHAWEEVSAALQAMEQSPEVLEALQPLLSAGAAGGHTSLRVAAPVLQQEELQLVAGPWGPCAAASCTAPSPAAARLRETWCAASGGTVRVDPSLCSTLEPLATSVPCEAGPGTGPCAATTAAAGGAPPAAKVLAAGPASTAAPEPLAARATLPAVGGGVGGVVALLACSASAWAWRRRRLHKACVLPATPNSGLGYGIAPLGAFTSGCA